MQKSQDKYSLRLLILIQCTCKMHLDVDSSLIPIWHTGTFRMNYLCLIVITCGTGEETVKLNCVIIVSEVIQIIQTCDIMWLQI